MPLTFRDATVADLAFIVDLMSADAVGETPDRPDEPDHPAYLAALAEIEADPRQRLIVAEWDGEPVGTLQTTIIPGLSRLGMKRCLVESVHIGPKSRNLGLGSLMMRWVMDEARNAGCGLVQLTSNKKRLDAHRFYERLGFEKSHEGFKFYF